VADAAQAARGGGAAGCRGHVGSAARVEGRGALPPIQVALHHTPDAGPARRLGAVMGRVGARRLPAAGLARG
jgi:hypothetical protein